MKLKKGVAHYPVKQRIDSLESAYCACQSKYQYALTQIRPSEMHTMLANKKMPDGAPTFISHYYSLDKHMVMIYPRPDKSYTVKIRYFECKEM